MIKSLLLGAVLGFISVFGYMSMNIKKSQRGALFPIISVIMTVGGAIIGGKIGHKLEKDQKITSALGLDKVSFQHYKVGRFWESESSWIDIEGEKHTIHTFKNDDHVITTLDGKHTLSHDKSASSVNITKYHQRASKEIFKAIREKYGEEFLQKYNQKVNKT